MLKLNSQTFCFIVSVMSLGLMHISYGKMTQTMRMVQQGKKTKLRCLPELATQALCFMVQEQKMWHFEDLEIQWQISLQASHL